MRLGATPNHKRIFYNKINRDDKELRVFRYELSTRGAYREKPYPNEIQLFVNGPITQTKVSPIIDAETRRR